ncbi:MAG: DUF5623 domain-containing protein [Sphingomonas sp.]
MSDKSVRPSTIDGIKSLATVIKREQSVTHAQALNLAARVAGYDNYSAARRALAGKARHRLWITVRWNNRKAKERGRETLQVTLAVPYGELVTPAQASNDRYLGNLRLDASDHVVSLSISEDQELARRRVCEIARTLQFLEGTDLKPSNARRAYPKGDFDNRVPDQDHASVWWDPVHRRHVLADEPYVRREDPISGRRQAWAERHGWEIVKPAWGGLYWPDGGCHLFLMTDLSKGPTLRPMVSALESGPPPIIASQWAGVSIGFNDPIVTPGARAAAAAKAAAVPKVRKPARKRASVAYIMSLVGRRLRPGARMPIAAHREAGQLLKSVLVATDGHAGAYNRVNAIRSELDEWVIREYSARELGDDGFSALYYHENDGAPYPSIDRDEMIGRLEMTKTILQRHYPDCPPLDAITARADKAIDSLRTWKPQIGVAPADR